MQILVALEATQERYRNLAAVFPIVTSPTQRQCQVSTVTQNGYTVKQMRKEPRKKGNNVRDIHGETETPGGQTCKHTHTQAHTLLQTAQYSWRFQTSPRDESPLEELLSKADQRGSWLKGIRPQRDQLLDLNLHFALTGVPQKLLQSRQNLKNERMSGLK